MKTSNETSLFAVVLAFAAFIGLMCGCGALQRTLYTTQPVYVPAVTNQAVTLPGATNAPVIQPGTNAPVTWQTNPQVVGFVQTTGGLFGATGQTAAGLLLGTLSLIAAWHNKTVLAQHVTDFHTDPPKT